MSSPTNRQFRPSLTVLEPALLVLLPIAVFAYGGVHHRVRLALTVLAIVIGVGLAMRSRYATDHKIGRVLGLGLIVAAAPLLPINAKLRSLLSGNLAEPVEGVVSLVGRSTRPLALDPWAGLFGWAEAAGFLLLGLGVAGWATRAGRSRRLMWVIIATGVAVVGLMVGHNSVGLESIYGGGTGGGLRDGFFAPFVNPNHGGIFLAAIAPLALTRLIDGRATERGIAALSVGALGFGVWASGSRGAVVALVLGLMAMVAAAGGRRTRYGVGVSLVVAMVGSMAAGLESVLETLSGWVAPSVNAMVEAGYTSLTTGRLELLDAGVHLLRQVPVLGVGPGGFENALRMVRDDTAFNSATHAHNEYVQLAVEHGLLVFALVMLGAVLIVRTGVVAIGQWSARPDRKWLIAGWLGCVSAMGVASLVDFPLRLHSHAILTTMALGSLVGLARPQRGGRRLSVPAFRWVLGAGVVGLLAVCAVIHGGVGPWSSSSDAQRDGEAWMDALPTEASRAEVLESAAAHFERAAVRGLNRHAFQWLARVRALQGERDEAERVLELGTQLDPTMPWLWRDRARLAQRAGDADLARLSWSRMLALDLPSSVAPMDVMHEAFFGGEFVSPIEQARAILPERADRYRQAARVMDQLGLVEEAETLFRRALSMRSTEVNSYAEALMKWGRPHDAVMLLEPNLNSCFAHRNYAQGLLDLRRYADAAEAFQVALSTCGARSWALRKGLCYARILSGDSRGDDAVEALLRERPESHKLRRAWLWVLSRRGRTIEGSHHLSLLKDMGVIRPLERVALERAQEGLPFVISEPGVNHEPRNGVVP